MKAYERLREELSPAYEALLKNVVAESDDGVRFVVDLRQVRYRTRSFCGGRVEFVCCRATWEWFVRAIDGHDTVNLQQTSCM